MACVKKCPEDDFYYRPDLCQPNDDYHKNNIVCHEEVKDRYLSCYNMTRYADNHMCARYHMKSELSEYANVNALND